MPLHYNKFIIEGRLYDWLPGDWDNLQQNVRKQTFATLDGKNITVIQQPPLDGANTFIENRKIIRQAWRASWTANAPCDRFMWDHLWQLWTLQKSFWLQYDDEMSRDNAILSTHPATGLHAYYTPTYPIAPYGYDPLHTSLEYGGTVFLNDAVQWNGFTVDTDTGMVRFAAPNAATDIVRMYYTWKARVRVESFALKPFNLAQTEYMGDVVFIQETPVANDDPWFPNLVFDETLALGVTRPGGAVVPFGDTRYGF